MVRSPATPDAKRCALLPGVEVRIGEVSDADGFRQVAFSGDSYDTVVSCMASRTGAPRDAWAVDHDAHLNVLNIAREQGVKQFILLSAICVQRPRLAFQHAKLKFERALAESGLTYSVVRPTAYFKSLSGQVERVRKGKPFLIFGDGRLTASKPISDADLAAYIADCITNPSLHDRVLPIGGPGPAITPREQGEVLFQLLGLEPRFKSVPPSMLLTISKLLGGLGRFVPSMAARAELARIGHYYATESMLVFDPVSGTYSAAATPETGRDTLFEYYRSVLAGDAQVERGEHAVF